MLRPGKQLLSFRSKGKEGPWEDKVSSQWGATSLIFLQKKSECIAQLLCLLERDQNDSFLPKQSDFRKPQSWVG